VIERVLGDLLDARGSVALPTEEKAWPCLAGPGPAASAACYLTVQSGVALREHAVADPDRSLSVPDAGDDGGEGVIHLGRWADWG